MSDTFPSGYEGEVAAIRETVQLYLAGSTPSSPVCRYATGDLERLCRLIAERVPASATPVDPPRRLDIRRLDVRLISGDVASVDLEGSTVPGGTLHRGSQDISGPVELRRVDGEWKMSWFTRAGRRTRPVIFDPPLTAETEDLICAVLAVELRAGTTYVMFDVTNKTEVPLEIRPILFVPRSFRLPPRALRSRVRWPPIPAGETAPNALLFPALPESTRKLELSIAPIPASLRSVVRLPIELPDQMTAAPTNLGTMEPR